MRKLLAAAGTGALLALTLPAAAQATGPAPNQWDGNVTVTGASAYDGKCVPWNVKTVDIAWTFARNGNDAGSKYNIAAVNGANVKLKPAKGIEANHEATGVQHGAEPGETYTITAVGGTSTNTASGAYTVPQHCNAWTSDRVSLTGVVRPAPAGDCLTDIKNLRVVWTLKLLNGDAITVGGTSVGLDPSKIVKGAKIASKGQKLTGTQKGVQPGDSVTLRVVGGYAVNWVEATVPVPALCPSPSSGTPAAGGAPTGSGSSSMPPMVNVSDNGSLPVTGWPLTLTIVGGALLLLTGTLLVAVTWRRRDRIRFQA
jgi:hypothetical protein